MELLSFNSIIVRLRVFGKRGPPEWIVTDDGRWTMQVAELSAIVAQNEFGLWYRVIAQPGDVYERGGPFDDVEVAQAEAMNHLYIR